MKLYTIGHGNHNFNQFIQLLEDNGIMVLVDVRTAPYSRYNPQFNKEELERVLPNYWMEYVYAGKYLGGRPSDPGLYKSRFLPDDDVDYLHEVDYKEIMKREWFIKAIERLVEMADEQTSVIMCSEEDPASCHRHHLIAKYLIVKHPEVDVYHIRGDGSCFRADTLHVSVDESLGDQLSFF